MGEFDISFTLAGNVEYDVMRFLESYKMEDVKLHTLNVANKAKELATINHYEPELAFTAGLLHDIGQVIPTDKRVEFCEKMNIEILKEERIVPVVLHAKISRHIAQQIFKISDEDILCAIECHTTLRKKSNVLDQLLFVADKLQWEEKDNAIFVRNIQHGLLVSIEHAAYAILDYLVGPNPAAFVMHPWAVEAYAELKALV